MSRSYKKSPFANDSTHSGRNRSNQKRARAWQKMQANKRVRQAHKRGEYFPDGNSYRRQYESWNIQDYCSRCSWEEMLEHWKRTGFPRIGADSEEELYHYWYKCYIMK